MVWGQAYRGGMSAAERSFAMDAAGSSPSAAAAAEAAPLVPRRWWVLATVSLAQLMVVLDVTIVNIALPDAQRDLAISNNDRQWVVTAYALAFGGLLLLGGRLSDLVGRRKIFLIGLIGFAVASATGGAAPTFEVLVIARSVQGVCAALLAPSALSVLTTTFTVPKERSRAFGVYGGIAGAGGAIGLLLGGFLTEHFSWRWTMYVNLIFALCAVLGAFAFLSGARGVRQRLDIAGAVLGGGGLFCLVFGFSRAEPDGWSSPLTWLPLALAALLLVLFVYRQRTAGQVALLPLIVVTDRNRGAAFISIFSTGAAVFGAFLFGTYYMQQNLSYSPLKTGVAFLPMVLALIVASQLCTNMWLPRFGPKIMVPLGLLLAAAGMASMATISVTSSYSRHLLPGLIIMGVGIGLAMSGSIQTATLGVDREHAGVASAVVSTAQQVGGAIGTAVLNTIATSVAAAYLAGAHVMAAAQGAGLSAAQLGAAVEQLQSDPTHLAGLTQAQAQAVQAIAGQAAVDSYTRVFWVSAGIWAGAALITAVMFRRRKDSLARRVDPV